MASQYMAFMQHVIQAQSGVERLGWNAPAADLVAVPAGELPAAALRDRLRRARCCCQRKAGRRARRRTRPSRRTGRGAWTSSATSGRTARAPAVRPGDLVPGSPDADVAPTWTATAGPSCATSSTSTSSDNLTRASSCSRAISARSTSSAAPTACAPCTSCIAAHSNGSRAGRAGRRTCATRSRSTSPAGGAPPRRLIRERRSGRNGRENILQRAVGVFGDFFKWVNEPLPDDDVRAPSTPTSGSTRRPARRRSPDHVRALRQHRAYRKTVDADKEAFAAAIADLQGHLRRPSRDSSRRPGRQRRDDELRRAHPAAQHELPARALPAPLLVRPAARLRRRVVRDRRACPTKPGIGVYLCRVRPSLPEVPRRLADRDRGAGEDALGRDAGAARRAIGFWQKTFYKRIAGRSPECRSPLRLGAGLGSPTPIGDRISHARCRSFYGFPNFTAPTAQPGTPARHGTPADGGLGRPGCRASTAAPACFVSLGGAATLACRSTTAGCSAPSSARPPRSTS